jgi:DNA-binding NarL/FixJ family response regulator
MLLTRQGCHRRCRLRPPLRLLWPHDHGLVRRGIRSLLRAAPDIEIVAETGHGKEALALARRLRPDVVLLDVNLGSMSGIDVARTLRHDLPETKVLMLTAYRYEAYVRTLLAIGVHGYLLKKASDTELIEGVRAVCRGETALSPEIAAQLTTRRSGIAVTGVLSEREREVLTLVADGASNSEIGRQLHLKVATVESYLSNIMGKLDARSRTDAVKLAVQRGIIVWEHD